MNISITPEITVAELLARWPETAPVLVRNHMACVGCSMSKFETLADASRIYRLSLEVLLADLHGAISPQAPVS